MKTKNIQQKLIMLSLAGCILLNLPLMEVANKPVLLWEIPASFLYVFAVWVLVLLGIFTLVKKENP
jgi:glucan phosphoethanolaminetransferase (alkaline phosphatase superfamily)